MAASASTVSALTCRGSAAQRLPDHAGRPLAICPDRAMSLFGAPSYEIVPQAALITLSVSRRPSDGRQTPWPGAGRQDVPQSPVSASLRTTICPGIDHLNSAPSKPSASLAVTGAPRLRAMAAIRQPVSSRPVRQTGDVSAVESGMGLPLRSRVACRLPPRRKQEPLSNNLTQPVRRYQMVSAC